MKKNNSRKFFAIFLALLPASFCFALPAGTGADETMLFSEISTAYSGAAYPLVIENADVMISSFPDSIYLHKVLLYKGESLCSLGRQPEAEKVLLMASESNDADIQVEAFYWLGKSRLAQEKKSDALDAFYRCCEISKSKKISRKSGYYYNMALYHAGEAYFASGEFEKCIPVFESVISRGDDYPVSAYSESFIMLFKSYLKKEKYQPLISIYKKLPEMKENFEGLYAELSLLASTAYEKKGEYKNAWICCKRAISSPEKNVSSEALRIAYRISIPYEKQTGEKTADMFENISEKFSADSELLAEFWTRVATDCFENGEYEDAASCFNKAELHDDKKKYAALISLYRARMKGNPLELLGKVEDDDELYSDYEAAFAEQYALVGDWQNCLVHSKKSYDNLKTDDDENLKRKSSCHYAASLLNTGKISEAEEILENGKASFKKGDAFYGTRQKILAQCFALTGREQKAVEIYSDLELNEEETADYAKILFSCGYLSSSKKAGLKSGTAEGKYIAALSCFNMKEWNEAENLFSDFLKTNETKGRGYAVFYLGYCQYKLGKSSAQDTLGNFSTLYPKNSLCYNSAVVCANSFIAFGNFKEALNQALIAITVAEKNSDRENAILLAASIHADSGDIDRSAEILSLYIKEVSDFGIACRFETAVLYSRKGKITESDRLFKEVCEKFPESKYAEESAYRRGDLFYSDGKYKEAAIRFDKYRKSYPKGKFYESSLFYYADCQKKIGDARNAILSYELLLAEFPSSTYAYGSSKNLELLYKEQGNLQKALESCRKMLANAMNDEQKLESKKEEELLGQMIASGNDEEILLKKKYESFGRQKTLAGRIAGTELAEYLWKKEKYSDEAIELAEKIYAEQIKKSNEQEECLYAAKNGIILAEGERHAGEYLSAADFFLAAAKYSKMCGNQQLAPRALYGAAEVFYSAEKHGDVKIVAEKLTELYPDSEYSKSVRSLLNDKKR